MIEAAPDLVDEVALRDYLDVRNQRSDLVMVEFGHGIAPAAYQQPVPFADGRRYIGVEGWMRIDDWGRIGRADIEALQARHPNPNIAYINHNLGITDIRQSERPGQTRWFRGDYQPQTALPPGIAHEVLLCNVFGDPQIAKSGDTADRLLREVARVARDDGAIVIAETYTPEFARLSDDALRAAGLQVEAAVVQPHPMWPQLDAIYYGVRNQPELYIDGKPHVPEPGSFYLFLSKAAEHATELQAIAA